MIFEAMFLFKKLDTMKEALYQWLFLNYYIFQHILLGRKKIS